MVRTKDSTIEQCLRRIVKEAVPKDEVTLKKVRLQAEAELKLGDGFFKNDEEWKGRSRDVIHAAFEEESEESEAPPAKVTPIPKAREASRPSSKDTTARPVPQQSRKETVSSTAKATVPASKAKAPSPDKNKSEDESSSSDSEEEDSSDEHGDEAQKQLTPKKPEQIPPKVNGVKRKASGSSTSEDDTRTRDDSSTENEDESDEPKKKKPRTESPSSSRAGSADDSEDQSEERSSNENARVEKPGSPQRDADVPAQPLMPAIPPKPYHPPPGFVALDSTLLTNDTAFASPNLNGKQMWHITAPSNVPLSSITDVALDAIRSGQPVLTYQNVEYVLNEDLNHSNDTANVLVPSTDGYKSIESPIKRTLQLQQKITLPNLSLRQADQATGSRAAADVGEAAVSSIRPQPKGLRMRFRPPGFGSGKLGRIGSGSESTDEDEQATSGSAFQFPRTLGAHKTAIAQGASAMTADGTTETLSRKTKKKRKDKDAVEIIEPGINGIPATSAISPPAQRHKEDSSSPDRSRATPAKKAGEKATVNQAPLVNGDAVETLSKEERRRLRRERKEAKQKVKEVHT